MHACMHKEYSKQCWLAMLDAMHAWWYVPDTECTFVENVERHAYHAHPA